MSQAKLKAACKASSAVLKTKLSAVAPKDVPFAVYALKNLPTGLRQWLFELLESNMKALYEASDEGYSPEEKRQELFNTESRFIVYGSPPVAYAVLRFVEEETKTDRKAHVVYCYEVQVERSARRTGAGKVLMSMLAELCKQFELEKVMLTVLKANEGAVNFYKSLGFTPDEICPSNYDNAEIDYWIMSQPCK